MSQRVNIQYSVELSELQSEVERLLQKASTNLEIAELQKTLKKPALLSLQTIEELDEVRQALAKADFILNDVTNIVTGYLNYRTTPIAPQEDLENLQQKLDDFKENFTNGESSNEVSD
jgi:hypothetical protein